ncbi:ADYC domain-containing protein [Paraliomyxa miuraensis]|uniref:ADYC domain-containing protein n=1 Tax=Paraliomyxa miuraensis TaxID=376150 RepID=UPI0022521B08|nr:ADYC domain-containing protein [Paraliomyxa miuraensis]MCX4242570.1 ADYC domain-containing protein [Paraliomyxa miuraensis]
MPTFSPVPAIVLTALLAAVGGCDPGGAQAPSQHDVTWRNGWGGLTMNTSNWVSAPSRDVYEFHRLGETTTNGFGLDVRLLSIAYPHPTWGFIESDPSQGALPGVPQVKIKKQNELALKITNNQPWPFSTTQIITGADLVGTELILQVDSPPSGYATKLRITGHAEDPQGGSLFMLERFDPGTHALLGAVCEPASDGTRLAAIYGDLSIDVDDGTVTTPDHIFHIACVAGAPGKAPSLGYHPKDSIANFRLANRIIRADYCAGGYPYTYPGNPLQILDNVSPGQAGTTLADVYAHADLNGLAVEAVWDDHGILCIDVPRVDELDPSDVFCPIKTLPNGPMYSWKPPPCDTFDDPAPGERRFFSLTAPS